ncbi:MULTISPECIES: BspA family leucine-rich repeat surface protein [unclassified Chryseobacterium]|uniref:BspA family leucine-rich repeat surface protein n=1 Tax=unclassified Chryseobacterium TaxID=2593645 RepID=UPI0012FF56DE|nr:MULTISPECIES: BspA family leucine-rich repeat surface protein [unclassified Chryseobacterium]
MIVENYFFKIKLLNKSNASNLRMMGKTFAMVQSFYQPVSDLDVAYVADFHNIFKRAAVFHSDIAGSISFITLKNKPDDILHNCV